MTVMSTNFTNIDQILVSLGMTENERSIIYENLAVILHLSKIEFESTDDGAQIIETTKKHSIMASKLMGILPEELDKTILFRSIEVSGTDIM